MHQQQKKTKRNLHPSLDMVTKNEEKAEILNATFTSAFGCSKPVDFWTPSPLS